MKHTSYAIRKTRKKDMKFFGFLSNDKKTFRKIINKSTGRFNEPDAIVLCNLFEKHNPDFYFFRTISV